MGPKTILGAAAATVGVLAIPAVIAFKQVSAIVDTARGVTAEVAPPKAASAPTVSKAKTAKLDAYK